VGSSGAGTPAVYAAAAMTEPILSPDALQFLAGSRRATLATIDDLGRPRLVPICFVVSQDRATEATVIHTALDEKPKQVDDPWRLARVHDITLRPAVSLLVDRWSEDWTELAWLRVHGDAILLEPGDRFAFDERAAAIEALRDKYPQYETHDLETRPLIRVVLTSATSWSAREG
jgi:PPOX class probable F420-dependent enzyme